MRVLLIAPGFPAEMPLFTRALASQGAEIIGLGDGGASGLPPEVREVLVDYWQVPGLWKENEDGAVREVQDRAQHVHIDRVECLWEPGVLLAARIREALDLPGMGYEQTLNFRDKEKMKGVLDEAGIRTPRHGSATTNQRAFELAEEIGYPLILKPIAGAGSMNTMQVENQTAFEFALRRLQSVPEISVEECVEGEEYTYDTICANGEVLFENVCWYRPKALVARSEEWISPQTIGVRDQDREPMKKGIEMGRAVLKALGFDTGFTHMEWFHSPSGEAVFCEIACRPPGARSVDVMVQATDTDLYTSWAEAVRHGKLSAPIERKFNSAVIFKRARGMGRIHRIDGVEELQKRFSSSVVSVDLLPVGSLRRNWKQTLLSDGWITLRNPDFNTTLEMADIVGREVHLFAD